MYSTTSVGGSGYFDGSSDYLSFSGASALSFSGQFSIEFWVYLNSIALDTINPSILTFPNQPSQPQIYINSANAYFSFWSGAADVVKSANGSAVLNTWNHVVVCRDSSNNMSMFLNGTRTQTTTSSTSWGGSSGTFLLMSYDGSQGDVNGYLSGFRTVHGSTPYDPTQSSITVPTAPPTAITNTSLLLNYTNAGIYDKAAKNDMETAGNAQVSTSVIKYGSGSMYFDGTGDYLLLPNDIETKTNVFFGSGEMTIEAWIYPTNVSTGVPAIVDYRPSSGFGAPAFSFWIMSGALSFYAGAYSGGAPVVEGGTISINTWTHVAVSRAGGVTKLFINGNQVASSTNAWNQTYGSTERLGIGATTVGTGNYFYGYISDLRITKGIGRYPYNFTPPTRSLPNFYAAPVTPTADPYFDYTTLLLPGSGTNGAQNNTFLDSSTNAFSITRNGNTTQGTFSPFSQTGWSNFFNGSSYLAATSVGTNFTFGTGDFTWECWAWFPDTSTDCALFGNGASGEMGIRRFSTGKIGISRNNVAIDASSAATVTANQWVHLAISRSSGTLRIFINGSQEYSAANSNSYNVTNEAFIGYNNGVYAINNTYISNMRIVKTGGIYTAAFTPSTTPLTTTVSSGTVTLLSCQSNRFLDNSTNAFALSVTGSPSVQAFSPFAPTAAYSAATNGGSGYFDGTGDYLNTSTSQIIPATGDFTLEAWVYPTSISSYPTIFNQGTAGTSGRCRLFIDASAVVSLQISASTVSSTATVKLNQWNYIAATRSGSSVSIYVNGAAAATGTLSDSIENTTLKISNDWESPTYGVLTGYISAARISTSIRSSLTTVPTTPFSNDANTKLLLNFTNAGITDATAKNDLETVGNAQISNGQAKWGSTSMYFDGTGDYLVTPSKAITTLEADFTIEWWNYRNTTGNNYMFTVGDSSTSTGIEMYIGSSGAQLNVYSNNGIVINAGTPPTYNTWSHYALVRYGGVVRLYVNGAQISSTWSSTASFSGAVYVGAEFYSGSVTGSANAYFNDFRITKGIARYTQSFTPPTAAFQLL